MKATQTLYDAAIVIARLAVGVVFIAHGWQKFFTHGLSRIAEQFGAIGIPQPQVTAAVVAGVELLAGIALIVGILTPLAGLLLAVDMAGALYFVHATNGPFISHNGWELVVALGACSLLLAATGAGRFSVDRLLGG